MSKARTTDLLYGHVGDAIYDGERKKWHFTREPRISRELKLLGTPFITVQPSIIYTPSDKIQSSLELSQSIKKLVKSFPEVVPAVSSLPVLARQSEIADQLASAHDPSKSDLLAFGKAADKTERSSRERYIPIAALSGGAAGEILRLVLLTGEDIGLRDKWDGKIRRLTTAGGCQGLWSGNGSPIQQLCFAKAKNTRKQWLGVRYHGATSILCPHLKSTSSSRRGTELSISRHQPSEIAANHVATISIQRTGGSDHADLSFNPWNHRQLAIVDQEGVWGIWILEKQVHRKDLWTTKAGLSGQVSKTLEDGPDQGVSRRENDTKHSKRNSKYGWGAILWAGDGNTLVVANRRTLSAYHVSQTLQLLNVPDLFLSETADWILDVRISPLDDSHIFLTTSSRIFWLRVLPLSKNNDYPDAEPGISILLSWRHFRDRDDISVRMSVLKDEDSTTVLLYSRLSALTSVYTFKVSDSPPGLPVSVSDPFVLPLSPDIQDGPLLNQPDPTTSKGRFISTLGLTKVKYAAVGKPKLGQFGFYQLSILYNDLSLSECLYFGQTTGNSPYAPIPQIQNHPAHRKAPASSLEKGFIVPNKIPFDRLNKPSPQGLSSQHDKDVARGKGPHLEEGPRTLNFEIIDRKIHELLSESTTHENSANSASKPLDQCLELIRTLILNKVSDDSTHQVETLHEILSGSVSVEDIDAASDALHLFVTSIIGVSLDAEDNEDPASHGNSQVSRLITPEILAALSTESQNEPGLPLSQVYDTLLKSWISTLSERIPGGVRVAMEKRLRKTATQLYLGNFGICPISEYAEIETKRDLETELGIEQTFNIAIREKFVSSIRPKLEQGQTEIIAPTLLSSQISEDMGFLPPAKPAPPLLVPERQSSLDPARSVASKAEMPEDPASKRLRALTNLTPQPKLPISSSNILRYWTVGSDPNNYDWGAVQIAIDLELENPPEDADEAETKKMEKRQRARREKVDAAIVMLSSNPSPPTRVKSTQSSPIPMPLTQETASQAPIIAIPSSQINMSQSRGLAKKKKTAGFR